MRMQIFLIFLFALSLQARASDKERISILDFTRMDRAIQKLVSESEVQDLTQQVRDVATSLIDPSRYEVMTRENILVMLPQGKKLEECEGQCEVETARNLGSRWHVVGDVKKVGTKIVLSVRLYDVEGGTQLGGIRLSEKTVDALADGVGTKARELLMKIPGLVPWGSSSTLPAEETSAVPSTSAPTKSSAPAGMVSIPAGCFMMGSTDGDNDEKPVHQVCLDGFSMDKYDVTQGAYRAATGKNPSTFNDCGDNCPVENVDWNEAKSYCESQGKRLPTEAEWEYAARAGTTTKWYWGNSEGDMGRYAWYNGNSGNTTHPVGQKEPNAWGLYDMAGNVWQWVSDWKGDYPSGSQRNPTGPGSGSHRVGRGGCWFFNPALLRSAYRGNLAPGIRGSYLGFRCVLP